MTNVVLENWQMLSWFNPSAVNPTGTYEIADIVVPGGQTLVYEDLAIGTSPNLSDPVSAGTVLAAPDMTTNVPVEYPASGYNRYFRLIGPIWNPSAVVQTFAFILNDVRETLTVVFSDNLNALSVPSATSFTITDSAGTDTPTALEVYKNTVVLTKSYATSQGDVLTVSYSGSDANPLQDEAGQQIVPFSSLAVVNYVSSPVLLGAAIATTTPTQVQLTFSAPLNAVDSPATTAFTLANSGGTDTVSVVSVSGNVVTLTKSRTTLHTDVVTVSYTVPGSLPLQDAHGELVAAFSTIHVTNGV